MLEREFGLGKQRPLYEELGVDECTQSGIDLVGRKSGDALEHGLAEVRPDHRRRLQDALFALTEPVEPRGDDGTCAGRKFTSSIVRVSGIASTRRARKDRLPSSNH